ncbi:hypothetical protein R1flu_006243 [Riccia fluitans]|uniref:Uncharacterized protein n=1 Tax=Riccia fluitans TaxID=41844 RepID=A0ABD1YY88_9MARC
MPVSRSSRPATVDSAHPDARRARLLQYLLRKSVSSASTAGFLGTQFCDDPLIVNLGLCKEIQTGDCFGILWMRDFEGGEDVSTFRTTVRSQSCSSRPETSPREHLERSTS